MAEGRAWATVSHSGDWVLMEHAFKPLAKLTDMFRQRLSETDFIEDRSVLVEYSYADNQLDRLPNLAAQLVNRPVNVIVANSLAAGAARSLTKTIPIVFVTADDPVTVRLAPGLLWLATRPRGLTFVGGGVLGANRVELLHELEAA